MNNLFAAILTIAACLFAFCNNNSEGTSPQSNYNFSEVENIINDAISDHAFPGAVVIVGKDGDIIFEKSFGHLTYEPNSPKVELSTMYDLASLTKVIATTTAAMLCIDKSLFSLDDPVSEFIPEFVSNGKEKVTIKNLLLHNSGLPAWKKYYNKNLSPSGILKDIYECKLQFVPGAKTLYSDLGMIVLGKVIEKATDKNLDEFCKEEIFNPLEMNNTFFNPPDSVKDNIAPTELDNYWRMRLIKGEVHDETSSLLGGVAGHAGLFSTANDIGKFLEMIMSEGRFREKQIISKETANLFTSKISAKDERLLGWDLKSESGSSAGEKFSKNSFGHTGFTGTSIWIDPVRNLFVVFLTNRVYPSRENKKIYKVRPLLHDAIIDVLE